MLGAMNHNYTCCICGDEQPIAGPVASVRSNVRRFASQTFVLWRCRRCGSIHARDEVDLDEYYRYYPFFGQSLDWAMACGYTGLLRRLRRAGLKKDHRIIDFGCGSGLLVQFLKEKGYDAVGYDPYSQEHGDDALLDRRYDCVIAQDVVEHAPDPLEVLRTLGRLAKPGGQITIGTPNAAGIDLSKPERFVHPLHQPYHRHIFSIDALRTAGENLGWSMRKYYSTPYTNMPILSLPFMHHYMRAVDGTIDVLFERSPGIRLWLNPKTYALLVAGYFLCDDADIVAIFQTPTE
jgi:2-polyprenyl-3-methyl-5-hydroxy-6-metoxy-1,4-benzoquinol methylase